MPGSMMHRLAAQWSRRGTQLLETLHNCRGHTAGVGGPQVSSIPPAQVLAWQVLCWLWFLFLFLFRLWFRLCW